MWEAVIKYALGKLPLPEAPAEYFPRQRQAHQIATLPIEEADFAHLASLPPVHRDPFDRILIAQARCENLTLLTVDPLMDAYDVRTLAASA